MEEKGAKGGVIFGGEGAVRPAAGRCVVKSADWLDALLIERVHGPVPAIKLRAEYVIGVLEPSLASLASVEDIKSRPKRATSVVGIPVQARNSVRFEGT